VTETATLLRQLAPRANRQQAEERQSALHRVADDHHQCQVIGAWGAANKSSDGSQDRLLNRMRAGGSAGSNHLHQPRDTKEVLIAVVGFCEAIGEQHEPVTWIEDDFARRPADLLIDTQQYTGVDQATDALDDNIAPLDRVVKRETRL
jgi:hypothetical protein